MLTPEELNTLHLNITKYYKELEEYTISDIARRIAKSEAITETALHQIRALQRMNLDLSNIEKKIKEIQKISDKELDKLYDEAVKRNNEFNDNIREKADLFPYVPDKTNQIFMLANALKEQTKNDLWNFTQSLGFAENIGGKTVFKPIAQFYQDTLNFAQMQIQSGVADYNTAIKQAVNKLAKSGLRTVDYESGYSSKIETAVRRAVLTGISQLSGEMTKQVMKEFNTDLVEVSAHQGARDKGIGPENHKLWQGKVYSLSGKNKKYPSLVKVTGYGTGEGLKGWNCRHDFFPFIEGVSERTYTDEELENIDPPPFEYEGKTYTAYEATQMQRKLETAMRNEKLKIIGYESSGLEDEMTSSSIRLRRLKNYYEDFSSKAGLKTQYGRTQAAGWGKSIAQKNVKKYENQKLPNYKNAVIPDEKISGYILNKSHVKGKDKAVAFEKALGYNIYNKDLLIAEIYKGLNSNIAVKREKTKYGQPFSVTMKVKGVNGKEAYIKTGWIIDTGKNDPRLVSAMVKERKK